ncbi:MAG: DNA mismatch repair endonuclease MutL, partial [Chloroflexota bacterium]
MTAQPASQVRNSIRVLPPEVAARIAAGEVIERPVSVVRELLDNAIDAGSTRISLEIEDGGITLIRVVDDGRGIPPEQLEVAFERHATSKIVGVADLSHVHTLGFRGEALPSIAAAADVEITSRASSEPVGVVAVLVDAHVVRRSGRPAPVGTSFAVRDLFGRLPARRKFLGSVVGESRQITVLASHYALAYPEIAFQFTSNGRRVLSTSGDGGLRHAFAAVYGAASAQQM